MPAPGGWCLLPGGSGPRGSGPGWVPAPGGLPAPGGSLLWGGLIPGRYLLPGAPGGETPPPLRTATAAGGTHPTGVHSCLVSF